MQTLAEEVTTAHRFYEDRREVCIPQKIRKEPPITIDIHGQDKDRKLVGRRRGEDLPGFERPPVLD